MTLELDYVKRHVIRLKKIKELIIHREKIQTELKKIRKEIEADERYLMENVK